MHERSDKKDDAVKPMSLCGVGKFSSFFKIFYVFLEFLFNPPILLSNNTLLGSIKSNTQFSCRSVAELY